MFALTAIGDICIGVGCYAAGALTWPWVQRKFIGAEAYAQKLRDKANAIITAARG